MPEDAKKAVPMHPATMKPGREIGFEAEPNVEQRTGSPENVENREAAHGRGHQPLNKR